MVYIRDILGHISVQTTEIYAKADSRQKREAIEKAYVDVKPKENPTWLTNNNLLEWFEKLLIRTKYYVKLYITWVEKTICLPDHMKELCVPL